jgi:rhodanese-related sulfurtransferase
MSKHSPRFVRLVDELRRRIRETDVPTVHARLGRGDAFHLVDVREESEWARGHLPGAVHLSRGTIERDIERAIPDLGAEIVLYCGGGYRSVLSADTLGRMGYTNVASMDGGFRGWTDAGHEVASG